MFITTIRVRDGKVNVTKHMHPSDAKAVVWMVRLLFGLCSVLAIGMFAAAYFGDETPLTDAWLTICGFGFVLMALRLRKAIGSVKQIPTSATKPAPVAQQPGNVMATQRRPDQRNGQEPPRRPRCMCGSKTDGHGFCRNRQCAWSRQYAVGAR